MTSASSRWLLSACCLFTTLNVHAQDNPTASVEGGQIQGKIINAKGQPIHAFLSIPFASPPVGKLRWRPPQPVKNWSNVRECREFPPACPQPADLVYGLRFQKQSEDCLYLNVWTPAQRGDKKLPVMVWIHGGGNTIGGSGSPIYDGRYLASAGVVLVSIQYRLGPFGYFAHPALTAETKRKDGQAASGNYGLMDQIAALKWVQNNINEFGGDKNRVTIFGESAGAANVTHLMASPLAKGLFHRGIAQSGYYGDSVPHLTKRQLRATSAHENGLNFAKRFDIKAETKQALTELRKLTVKQILSIPLTIGRSDKKSKFRFGPIVDGYVLPQDPGKVWESGEMHNVPFLAGSTLDDGSVFSRGNPIRNTFAYGLALRTIFGPEAQKAREVFPAKTNKEVPKAVHKAITILAFREPARRLVRYVESAQGKSWLYLFSRNPGKGRALREGVFHGLEIPYVFGTLTRFGNKIDKQVAATMTECWVNFARYGDPNGKDKKQPLWPVYNTKEDKHLDFGDVVRVGSGLDQEACDLVDRAVTRKRQR